MRRFIDSPEKFGAALVALLAFAGVAAFAAGNSGGAVHAPKNAQGCVRDIWDCGDWSACTIGFQDRRCSLAYDCAGVSTPKPATRQSCSIAPVCDGANWRCDDWQGCSADGVQLRNCRHANECPDQLSVKPDTVRACPTLQCDQPALRERVTCRLGLSDAGAAREDQIRYLPETCRSVDDLSARNDCIAEYKSLDPCRTAKLSDDRLACARTVLGVSSDVKGEALDCDAPATEDRKACRASLRTKVGELVLFRMYDLERRAEDARQYGTADAAVADLTVSVEESEIAFMHARDDAERTAAVMSAREAWRGFIAAVDPAHPVVAEGSR